VPHAPIRDRKYEVLRADFNESETALTASTAQVGKGRLLG
jgi:hypothetical protein